MNNDKFLFSFVFSFVIYVFLVFPFFLPKEVIYLNYHNNVLKDFWGMYSSISVAISYCMVYCFLFIIGGKLYDFLLKK